MRYLFLSTLLLSILLLAGCSQPQQDALNDQRFTLGLVQKEIKEGMDQTAVMEVLGTPNFVTKDGKGHETWVYDKVATTASTSSGSGGALIGLASGIVGGLGGGTYSKSDKVTSQKTLTVVIRFDEGLKVSSTAYQSSRY